MKFSIRFADQIVGVLIILALAILVFVVFMLGRSQRWFARDIQYKTYFTSAAGLSPNMSVQYKGFSMGRVKKIMLTENDTVEVNFIIFEEHRHRIKEGTLVEVVVSPIGLGNSFLLHPGRGKSEIPEGEVIPEINSQQAKFFIENRLVDKPETGDSIGNIVNQVNMLLDTINVALAGSQEMASSKEKSADDLAIGQILINVNDVIGGVKNIVDPLSLRVDPVLGEVQSLLAQVQALIDDLNKQLNPILADVGTLTDQLSQPSGTVMSILDGEGLVYKDLLTLLESVTGILVNLEKTSDVLPAQIPGLLLDINAALRTAQDVLVSLTNNPLLKGGVPVRKETGPAGANPRNLEF
ncbi:MAG: MlaD family protein [Treponema sp.]|jgi:phospholipid/cholesterol/gamma-HCH transport system substrate-binding protein|nr:MlaD family protein [Treponema sp.]